MQLINRQLRALAAVIETGNFDRAAERLNISQSAVSQRIKQLEQQSGHTLLLRSNPPVPTELGKRLMNFYRQAELLESEMFGDRENAVLNLTVGINADSLATWFIPATAEFVKERQVMLDLKLDDQDQTLELLRTGDVIGSVSSQKEPISGCDSYHLGNMTYHSVCTEEFRQTFFADGPNAHNFTEAPALHFGPKDRLQENYLAEHFHLKVAQYRYHQIPSVENYLDFIRRGLAWGMVPELQCKKYIDRGDLVKLTPDLPVFVPLYWHTWSVKSNLVREFTQLILKYCNKKSVEKTF